MKWWRDVLDFFGFRRELEPELEEPSWTPWIPSERFTSLMDEVRRQRAVAEAEDPGSPILEGNHPGPMNRCKNGHMERREFGTPCSQCGALRLAMESFRRAYVVPDGALRRDDLAEEPFVVGAYRQVDPVSSAMPVPPGDTFARPTTIWRSEDGIMVPYTFAPITHGWSRDPVKPEPDPYVWIDPWAGR